MNARLSTKRARTGSLTVVGTGISGPGQTTLEAVECMRRADKLFYAVVEPSTEFWIRQVNASSTTLADLYDEHKERSKTYHQMVTRIVTAVRSGLQVCAVFYGHPGVLVEASHRAIRQLRREGYPARMFPGVGADACLYADLGVNPGDRGVQSFEATDFLLSRRRFDPTSDLILWQVGVLGESTARKGTCRPERLRTLTRRLQKHYPRAHRVVLYQASTFPARAPMIKRLPLGRLPESRVRPIAMLYVPARAQRSPDPTIARWH